MEGTVTFRCVMRKILSSLPGLLASLWLVSATAAAQARGEIGFVGAGASGADIYLVAADGSSLINITRGRLSGIVAFAWSPDGARIASPSATP